MKLGEPLADRTGPIHPFATAADYEECRRLHRKHGTTYYFATQRFEPDIRRRVNALYGFVRVPDEWVDNAAGMSLEDKQKLLSEYRSQLIRGLDGVMPTEPVLRAFCDVMREVKMPLDEPLIFLDAMEMDLTITRYETYNDLRDYMRGSASAVGLMMCQMLGVGDKGEVHEPASALGEAMQLTNFLRDVGEDLRRGRIYLPLEDMAAFGVSEQDILSHRQTPQFDELMKFEIDRARKLYVFANQGIHHLPKEARKAVKLGSILYSRILDRIEERKYDVFSGRARTSTAEKLLTALRVSVGLL